MTQRILDRIAYALGLAFLLDRCLKLAAVMHFFKRRPPEAPSVWPSVSLIQPISRGATDLQRNLWARAQLDYPGQVQYVLICDAADVGGQAVCQSFLTAFPNLHCDVVVLLQQGGPVSPKVPKLLAGLAQATGKVVCFIDDDVAPRPTTLRQLVAPLSKPDVGASFGLACYTDWHNVWSSLMSSFVNANALLSYVPLTYLTEPYTITGHLFALRRETFETVGGVNGLEQRVDDDHELARRLRGAGLRVVQTASIYDVANALTRQTYSGQMKRWFVLPRQAMLPLLKRREQVVTIIGSMFNLVPGLLLVLAVTMRRRRMWLALAASLTQFCAVYALCEGLYLRRRTPLRRWPLVPITALLAPFQVVWGLLSDDVVEWRGQRLRVHKGGRLEVLA